jgi:chemotaxis protein MotB
MSTKENLRPIIIKKKKVISGGGHHGGAWKVAYADFVTAMMAFFMLMWLLNATTEQQRKGLADYFSPTVPIARISGGGDGSFGGDSVFSEDTTAQNGTGATSQAAAGGQQSLGNQGVDLSEDEQEQRAAETQALAAVEDALMGAGGESMLTENALRHVQTRLSDEGLIIEIYARPNAPLFVDGSLAPFAQQLAAVMAELFKMVTNSVAIEAHVRANVITLREEVSWIQSTGYALAFHVALEAAGLDPDRLVRITGHGDRQPMVPDRMGPRNDRIEVILLRSDI